jgi:hypothetical protein
LDLDAARQGWAPVFSLCGIDEQHVIAALAELTSRRLFLPDSAMSRVGGDTVSLYFGFFGDSLQYYEILHRAFAVSEPLVFRELDLGTPETVGATWRKLTIE